jgi:hypothetical protein
MAWQLDPFGNLLINVDQAMRLGRRVRAAWVAAQFRAVIGTLSPYFFSRTRAAEALAIADRVASGGSADYATEAAIHKATYAKDGLVNKLESEGYSYVMITSVPDLLGSVDGLFFWERVEPKVRGDNPPELYAANNVASLAGDLALAFATICVWRQGVQVRFSEGGIDPEYFDALHMPFFAYSMATYQAALAARESDAGPALFAAHNLDWSVPPLAADVRARLTTPPPPHEVEHMRSMGVTVR